MQHDRVEWDGLVHLLPFAERGLLLATSSSPPPGRTVANFWLSTLTYLSGHEQQRAPRDHRVCGMGIHEVFEQVFRR